MRINYNLNKYYAGLELDEINTIFSKMIDIE